MKKNKAGKGQVVLVPAGWTKKDSLRGDIWGEAWMKWGTGSKTLVEECFRKKHQMQGPRGRNELCLTVGRRQLWMECWSETRSSRRRRQRNKPVSDYKDLLCSVNQNDEYWRIRRKRMKWAEQWSNTGKGGFCGLEGVIEIIENIKDLGKEWKKKMEGNLHLWG